MDDHRKTKKQLIAELVQSRERVTQLEDADAERKQLEEGRTIAGRVLTSSPDLICVAGMDGYFKYLNPAWEKSLGYTQAELLSRPFLDFIHPDDHAKNDTEVERLAAGRQTFYFENRYLHKDGSILTISWAATAIPEGEVMYCIGRDITQRKKVEQALQQNERLLKSAQSIAHLGYYQLNIQTGQATWSEETFRILGRDPSEGELTIETYQTILHPDDKDRLNQLLDESIKEQKQFDMIYRIRRANGEIRYVHSIGNLETDPADGTVKMFGTLQDITERVHAEELLKKSETELKKAQQVAHVGSWTWHISGNRLEWSDEMYRIFGIEQKDFTGDLGDVIQKAIHPDDRAAVEKSNLSVIKDRKSIPLKYRIIHPDGAVRTVWAEAGELVLDEAGNPALLTGIVQDITEQKQVEESLRESRAKLNAALSSMTDAVFISDTAGEFIEFNEAFALFHRFKNKAECANRFSDYPEILDVYMDNGELAPLDMWAVPRALRGETATNAEYTLYRKDTGETWVGSYSFAPILDNDGGIIGSVVVGQDITERKRVEEALRDSEERFRAIASNIPDHILMQDRQLRYTFVINPQLGLTEQDMLGQTDHDFLSKEEADQLTQVKTQVLESGRSVHFENSLISKEGEPVFFDGSYIPKFDSSGKINGLIGYFRNVTNRKQSEQALRESETLIRTIMDNIPLGIAVNSVDPAVEFTYMNDNFPKFYRTTREALANPDAFWDAVYEEPGFREEIKKRVLDDCVGNDPKRMHWVDVPITRKGDKTTFITARNTPIPDTQLMISTVWDVTKRKLAEEQLRASEANLAAAQRIAHIGSWEWDMISNTTKWSNELYRVFDISPGTNDGEPEFLMPRVHPDDVDIVADSMKNVSSSGKLPPIDYRVIYKDGSIHNIHAEGWLEFDEAGNPIKNISTAQDITERKQTEDQLKLALADKETLLQELYHRTKNNMQAIMGLIDLQSAQSQDEHVQTVLKETQNRVRSMALVHQKLYQSQNLSSIDLGEYIRELTALLMESYQVAPDRVSLVLELEPIPVLIDTAVPCGLIINELVSNVFKHAFPHNEPGELRVILKQLAADEILFQVADDGVGLPSGFDPRESDSLGLQTVFGIAEYQLQGKITYQTAKGVTWRLQFFDTLYQPRV